MRHPRWSERLRHVLRLGPKPPHAWLRQSRPDNCAQTVVSMITGAPVSKVCEMVRTEGPLSVSETLAVLSRLGCACRPVSSAMVADFWPLYQRRAGGRRLRGVAFRVARPGEPYGHAYLLFGKKIYDPLNGEFRALDASVLRGLDWIALLPVEEA